MNWSQLAFLGGTLPVPFLISMILIPETPRWFVSKGKQEQARKALQWLRGKKADVEPELKGIIKSHVEAEKNTTNTGIMRLLKKCNLKPLSISLGLMFFQQFSGINAVIFYANDIFIYAGSTIHESICVIIIGVVNFVATFIATILIDRLGRKVKLTPKTHLGNQWNCADQNIVPFINSGSVVHLIGWNDHNVGCIGWIFLRER